MDRLRKKTNIQNNEGNLLTHYKNEYDTLVSTQLNEGEVAFQKGLSLKPKKL